MDVVLLIGMGLLLEVYSVVLVLNGKSSFPIIPPVLSAIGIWRLADLPPWLRVLIIVILVTEHLAVSLILGPRLMRRHRAEKEELASVSDEGINDQARRLAFYEASIAVLRRWDEGDLVSYVRELANVDEIWWSEPKEEPMRTLWTMGDEIGHALEHGDPDVRGPAPSEAIRLFRESLQAHYQGNSMPHDLARFR